MATVVETSAAAEYVHTAQERHMGFVSNAAGVAIDKHALPLALCVGDECQWQSSRSGVRMHRLAIALTINKLLSSSDL